MAVDMNSAGKVALITGSNRGLGLATAKALTQKGVKVIISARDNESGRQVQNQLQTEGVSVDFQNIDVNDIGSIQNAANAISQKYGKLDILINNAAIYPEADKTQSGLVVSPETVDQVLQTNVLGPLKMIQQFLPLLQKGVNANIINITSGLGQMKNLAKGSLAYRMSKTALNAMTKVIADELKNTGVRINALCPLWVKTAMGGDNAKRTPEEAAAHIVNLALDTSENAPNGQFLREGRTVDW
jgi:NAD(P)-dependent dehydrogenase (short-subunit alcohol dehydrogenase family)